VTAWLAALLAAAAFAPPPANARFDYQIGEAYRPPAGVRVVSRDWSSRPPRRGYAVCYVNAFQSQPEVSWPPELVLRREDPGWPGEFLIDIGTPAKRRAAAAVVQRMIETCARKGFDAVEYDNLDSWTRVRGLPFGKRDALAYARLIARRAHALGLAVAQKNTAELTRAQVRRVGFDFTIAEECGRYRECGAYRRLYGDRVLAIEYRRRDFRAACRAVGDRVAVVLRDRDVTAPGSRTYRFDSC
jgi:endo-alpha-1,4-polygalactosaminidase (GH114 family)